MARSRQELGNGKTHSISPAAACGLQEPREPISQVFELAVIERLAFHNHGGSSADTAAPASKSNLQRAHFATNSWARDTRLMCSRISDQADVQDEHPVSCSMSFASSAATTS